MRRSRQKCAWIEMVECYREELGLEWHDVERLSIKYMMNVVDSYEKIRWKRDIEEKSTLEFYTLKENIGGESYDNSWGSRLMFAVRSNALRLGWRCRFAGGEVECQLCRGREETLKHFLLECPTLTHIRERYEIFSVEDVVCFGTSNLERAKQFLVDAWEMRRHIIENGRGGI